MISQSTESSDLLIKGNASYNLPLSAASVDSMSSEAPKDRRLSCHRCGNIRKRIICCKECPHIFCINCSEKMREEYGADVFQTGCPVCKDLCCCRERSLDCTRKHHCYKKCPVSKIAPPKSASTDKQSLEKLFPEGSDTEFEMEFAKVQQETDEDNNTSKNEYKAFSNSADPTKMEQKLDYGNIGMQKTPEMNKNNRKAKTTPKKPYKRKSRPSSIGVVDDHPLSPSQADKRCLRKRMDTLLNPLNMPTLETPYFYPTPWGYYPIMLQPIRNITAREDMLSSLNLNHLESGGGGGGAQQGPAGPQRPGPTNGTGNGTATMSSPSGATTAGRGFIPLSSLPPTQLFQSNQLANYLMQAAGNTPYHPPTPGPRPGPGVRGGGNNSTHSSFDTTSSSMSSASACGGGMGSGDFGYPLQHPPPTVSSMGQGQGQCACRECTMFFPCNNNAATSNQPSAMYCEEMQQEYYPPMYPASPPSVAWKAIDPPNRPHPQRRYSGPYYAPSSIPNTTTMGLLYPTSGSTDREIGNTPYLQCEAAVEDALIMTPPPSSRDEHMSELHHSFTSADIQEIAAAAASETLHEFSGTGIVTGHHLLEKPSQLSWNVQGELSTMSIATAEGEAVEDLTQFSSNFFDCINEFANESSMSRSTSYQRLQEFAANLETSIGSSPLDMQIGDEMKQEDENDGVSEGRLAGSLTIPQPAAIEINASEKDSSSVMEVTDTVEETQE